MLELVDLRTAWLFENLTAEEVALVAGVVDLRTCPAETVLASEGSADRSLFVVLSGSVRIVRREPGGAESPIAEVLPGQHLGEVTFVDGGVRSATAVTNEPTTLAVLEPRRFQRLCDQEPAAATKILWSMLRLLCGRLRSTDYWLFELMETRRAHG